MDESLTVGDLRKSLMDSSSDNTGHLKNKTPMPEEELEMLRMIAEHGVSLSCNDCGTVMFSKPQLDDAKKKPRQCPECRSFNLELLSDDERLEKDESWDLK